MYVIVITFTFVTRVTPQGDIWNQSLFFSHSFVGLFITFYSRDLLVCFLFSCLFVCFFFKNSGYLCNWELLATLAEMNCFVSGKLLTWEGKMHRGMICTFQKKKIHTIEGIKILNPNECELKAEAIRPTDIKNSKTFLIRSRCDTAPIHLINPTFSSCRSASFNSWPQSLRC